ncbi:hypothetical protein [Eleftheria terrae]|nr:hypothetical protein [Eleftheria terrae]WKB52987.1 hypothetical protein N7L95_00870 [Eleftheria terrae]
MRCLARAWLRLRLRWAEADMREREFLFAPASTVLGYLIFIADTKHRLEK